MKRFLESLFGDSGALVLLAIVGIAILVYIGDWSVFKEILITFQPVMYIMALLGMITMPFLAFKQLWVSVICNFALSAGLMYLAQVVIESWR